MYSYLLVIIQFICIWFLILNSSFSKIGVIQGGVMFLGIFLGLWAIWTMRRSKLHLTPDVDRRAVLISDGAYKHIRHPMYSAILLFCFGLLMVEFSIISLVVYLVLTVDLVVKLKYEEKLLRKHFDSYSSYEKKTFRLIPYLF